MVGLQALAAWKARATGLPSRVADMARATFPTGDAASPVGQPQAGTGTGPNGPINASRRSTASPGWRRRPFECFHPALGRSSRRAISPQGGKRTDSWGGFGELVCLFAHPRRVEPALESQSMQVYLAWERPCHPSARPCVTIVRHDGNKVTIDGYAASGQRVRSSARRKRERRLTNPRFRRLFR